MSIVKKTTTDAVSHSDTNARAVKLVRDLIGRAAALEQSDLEALCKASLLQAKEDEFVAKHETIIWNNKTQEKNILDMISNAMTLMTPDQKKNHAIRFGFEEEVPSSSSSMFGRRITWNFVGTARTSFLNAVGAVSNVGNAMHGGAPVPAAESHDYEDVISEEILHAPITEICIIQRGEPVPAGFYRLTRTPSNRKANLNAGSNGHHLYLCMKKDTARDAIPLTALVVIFPDRGETVPPGFFVARHDKLACNLNSGTNAERVHLCYRKERSGNPIVDIQVILTGRNEDPPKSFNVIDKSPTNLPANLNQGTTGGKITLCYRQSLTRFDCLLNNEKPSVALLKSLAAQPMLPNPATVSALPSIAEGGPSQSQSQTLTLTRTNRTASVVPPPLTSNNNNSGNNNNSNSSNSNSSNLFGGGPASKAPTGSPLTASSMSLASLSAAFKRTSSNPFDFEFTNPIAGMSTHRSVDPSSPRKDGSGSLSSAIGGRVSPSTSTSLLSNMITPKKGQGPGQGGDKEGVGSSPSMTGRGSPAPPAPSANVFTYENPILASPAGGSSGSAGRKGVGQAQGLTNKGMGGVGISSSSSSSHSSAFVPVPFHPSSSSANSGVARPSSSIYAEPDPVIIIPTKGTGGMSISGRGTPIRGSGLRSDSPSSNDKKPAAGTAPSSSSSSSGGERLTAAAASDVDLNVEGATATTIAAENKRKASILAKVAAMGVQVASIGSTTTPVVTPVAIKLAALKKALTSSGKGGGDGASGGGGVVDEELSSTPSAATLGMAAQSSSSSSSSSLGQMIEMMQEQGRGGPGPPPPPPSIAPTPTPPPPPPSEGEGDGSLSYSPFTGPYRHRLRSESSISGISTLGGPSVDISTHSVQGLDEDTHHSNNSDRNNNDPQGSHALSSSLPSFDIDQLNDIDACVEQPPSDHRQDSSHPTTTDLQLTRQHDRQELATGPGATLGESTSITTTAHLLNNPRMSYSELGDRELCSALDRSHQAVVDAFGNVLSIDQRLHAHALLVALYVRQGNLAQHVLAGLTSLLKETDFFAGDLHALPPAAAQLPGASTITLLDLTIEAVCDRVDHCLDIEHDTILQFFRELIKHSNGRLSFQSHQRFFRISSFLFGTYSSKLEWVKSGQPGPCLENGSELPALAVFRRLVSVTVYQVEEAEVAYCLPDAQVDTYDYLHSSEAFEVSRSFVVDFVENLIDSIEISRATEACNLLLSKQSSNASSAVFWTGVVAISKRLFAEEAVQHRSAFLSLCAICKLAWAPLRTADSSGAVSQTSAGTGLYSGAAGGGGSSGAPAGPSPLATASLNVNTNASLVANNVSGGTSSFPNPTMHYSKSRQSSSSSQSSARDLGSKLLALDGLYEFCASAGEKMVLSKVVGYQIRRLVVPCLLSNLQYAIYDHRIFSKVLHVITVLWKVWRVHVRIEIANICEKLVIRILQAPTLKIRPAYQMTVLEEVVMWFGHPDLLVDMFVNFDMDRHFVSHWKVFSHLVKAFCATARKISVATGAWDWKPGGHSSTVTPAADGSHAVSNRDVHMKALEEVTRVAKVLMDSSGHAHLMMKDSSVRLRSIGHNAGWEEDDREGCMGLEQGPGLLTSSGLPLEHQELASFSSSSKETSQHPLPGTDGAAAGGGHDNDNSGSSNVIAAAAECLTPYGPPPASSTTPSSTTTYPPTAVTNSGKLLPHPSSGLHAGDLREYGSTHQPPYDTSSPNSALLTPIGYTSASGLVGGSGSGSGHGGNNDIDDNATMMTTTDRSVMTGSPVPFRRMSSDGNLVVGGVGRPLHARSNVRQSIRHRREKHQEAEDILDKAIQIFRENGNSLKKATKYLVSKNFMNDSPQEIATFLRVYKNAFDPSSIGDFLGEGGTTHDEEIYRSQIRFRYTRAISFVELEVEPALRLYLTGCGFRLPGEAQKVDRFVEVFVKAFWQDNQGTPYCPFRHPDTVHLLAYATIMLNTDLHRANIDTRKKSNRKMTKEEFMNNLKGSDQGFNMDKDYLGRIYDNIKALPIELAVEAAEGLGRDHVSDPLSRSKHGFGGTASGSGLGALGAIGSTTHSLTPTVPAALSLEALSMGLTGTLGAPSVSDTVNAEERAFAKDLARRLRDSEDLLRSLSPFTYRFQVTGVDTKISLELVSFMFEKVSLDFQALLEDLLSEKQQTRNPTTANERYSDKPNGTLAHSLTHTLSIADTQVLFAAIDILNYSLSSSIFLDLKKERKIFADQLLSFQKACRSSGDPVLAEKLSDDAWFDKVKTVGFDNAFDVIADIHQFTVLLKDSIQESSSREKTKAVAARIERKAKVLETNTFFVREGDLSKKNRSGRFVQYRFFLFSDELIYAKIGIFGVDVYKVHEQLSLLAMSISDIEDPTGCSFFISHPTKSFMVVCESRDAKCGWLRDIVQNIGMCRKREARRTAEQERDRPQRLRKMSILGRIEEQQLVQPASQYKVFPLAPSSAWQSPESDVDTGTGLEATDMTPQDNNSNSQATGLERERGEGGLAANHQSFTSPTPPSDQIMSPPSHPHNATTMMMVSPLSNTGTSPVPMDPFSPAALASYPPGTALALAGIALGNNSLHPGGGMNGSRGSRGSRTSGAPQGLGLGVQGTQGLGVGVGSQAMSPTAGGRVLSRPPSFSVFSPAASKIQEVFHDALGLDQQTGEAGLGNPLIREQATLPPSVDLMFVGRSSASFISSTASGGGGNALGGSSRGSNVLMGEHEVETMPLEDAQALEMIQYEDGNSDSDDDDDEEEEEELAAVAAAAAAVDDNIPVQTTPTSSLPPSASASSSSGKQLPQAASTSAPTTTAAIPTPSGLPHQHPPGPATAPFPTRGNVFVSPAKRGSREFLKGEEVARAAAVASEIAAQRKSQAAEKGDSDKEKEKEKRKGPPSSLQQQHTANKSDNNDKVVPTVLIKSSSSSSSSLSGQNHGDNGDGDNGDDHRDGEGSPSSTTAKPFFFLGGLTESPPVLQTYSPPSSTPLPPPPPPPPTILERLSPLPFLNELSAAITGHGSGLGLGSGQGHAAAAAAASAPSLQPPPPPPVGWQGIHVPNASSSLTPVKGDHDKEKDKDKSNKG